MLGRLHGYAAEGHGVVVVLHDLSHAARIADDVMLLSEGRLVAFGPAENVLRPELLEQVYRIGFERVGPHLIPTLRAPAPHSPAGR